MYLGLMLLLSAYYLLQPTLFSPFDCWVYWYLTLSDRTGERVLDEKFGDLYLQYKQTVRRWI